MEEEKIKCVWCDGDFPPDETAESRFIGGKVCHRCNADEGSKTLGDINERMKERSAEYVESRSGVGSAMITQPYDPETRIRIAETRQHRAEEQSIKDAGRYVDISMKNNRLTAENIRLKQQLVKIMQTMHAAAGYQRVLALPAPEVVA